MTIQELKTEPYLDEGFKRRLAADVEHAADQGRPYAVVAFVPQRLSGEDVADVMQIAADCVHGLVRRDDVPGILGDEVLAIGLPKTTASGAQAFAHRLQSDLGLRSARLRSTVWDADFACPPDDGHTALELLLAAITGARTRRRRLGR